LGDTWAWTATVDDYPATEWTLKFAFRGFGLSVIDITATASGDDYEATVAGGITAGYLKGTYQWTAFIEKGVDPDTERYTVGSGTVVLLPYLAAATGATDNRSHAQKMLDAIETALEAAGSNITIVALTVNGKSVQYKRDDLLKMRAKYRREVARERGESSIVGIQFGSA
jgi:hypothetical protein